jgi:hypothetical protein
MTKIRKNYRLDHDVVDGIQFLIKENAAFETETDVIEFCIRNLVLDCKLDIAIKTRGNNND